MNIPKHIVQHGHSILIGAEQSDDNISNTLHLSNGMVPLILLFSNLKLSDFRKSELNLSEVNKIDI